jgi:site-specific DNA-cytosine methylase
LTQATFFSGIDGFGLAGEVASIRSVFHCEIDKNCQKLLRSKYPDIPIESDINNVSASTFRKYGIKPDIISGGFPCQDLSIAGKRGGLSGKRSGMYFEFHRIVSEELPPYVIVENVPGLLSSNDGKDFQIVIDNFTQIGYVVDVDIKDAQEFGLAQRRKRVFFVCVRLDDLLKQKTSSSRQISADLLAPLLHGTWHGLKQALSAERRPSDLESPGKRSLDSLPQRIGLLKRAQDAKVLGMLQEGLVALLDQFTGEPILSELNSTEQNERLNHLSYATDILKSLLTRAEISDVGHSNISTLLSKESEDACDRVNRSTISITTNLITDQRIFIYSVLTLHTVRLILPYLDWSQNYWSAVLSLSTLTKELTNYAGQASRELFIEDSLRDGWGDYFSAASDIQVCLERCSREIRRREILFESESLSGNPPPSRKTRERIAATLTTGVATNSNPPGRRQEDDVNIVTTFDMQAMGQYGESPVASTLKQRDFKDATDLVVGKRRPELAIDIAATLTGGGNGARGYNIDAEHGLTVYGFSAGQSSEAGSLGYQEEQSPTLRGGASGTNQVPTILPHTIHSQLGVRRLTPLECERLQGFPDNWTAGFADSTRYKMIGNAVAVPCVAWIMKRIVLFADPSDHKVNIYLEGKGK